MGRTFEVVAAEPAWGHQQHKPDDESSAGEGRWLARVMVAGLSVEWAAFSTRELRMAEDALVDEQRRLNERGIECTEEAVSIARVELARERARRLHTT